MIKIEFNGIPIKVASNPDEISLEKGLNIHYIWSNQEHNLETKKEVLFILTNLKLCYKLSENSINDIINNLNLLDFEEIELIYYPTFTLNKKCYGLHKLKRLNVKEFMDLEFYLSHGDNTIEYLDKLCSIIYRPIKYFNRLCKFIKYKNNNVRNILYNIKNKLYLKNIRPILYKNYEIEDYCDEHLKNSVIFKEKFTYSMGISSLLRYNLYKEELIKEYPPLFPKINKEEDPFAEEEAAYLKEHPIGKSFEELYGFYHVFMELIPLSEQEKWLKKDIKELLKLLVYMKAKTNIQNQTK